MTLEHVKLGVSTSYLDNICHNFMVKKLTVVPANVGYYGYSKKLHVFPKYEVVCHGIPSEQEIIQEGDIIDIAIIKDGYYSDTSRMYSIGKVKPEHELLNLTTYKPCERVYIKFSKVLGDIGFAIQAVAQKTTV